MKKYNGDRPMNNNKKLMIETLQEIDNYLPKVMHAVQSMVSYFQGGSEQQAIEVFGPFTEAMQWLLDAITLTKSMQEEYDIHVSTQELEDVLPQLLEGWENSDYILISDILEYEILPILEQWQGEIGKIKGVYTDDLE
ncbi:MAG: hypothetical protein PWP27_1921 [Clostridiales bacterium]|nr:hypothetical protein [Clostridiales bacterium]